MFSKIGWRFRKLYLEISCRTISENALLNKVVAFSCGCYHIICKIRTQWNRKDTSSVSKKVNNPIYIPVISLSLSMYSLNISGSNLDWAETTLSPTVMMASTSTIFHNLFYILIENYRFISSST